LVPAEEGLTLASPSAAPNDAIATFCQRLRDALHSGQLSKGVLAKYRGPVADLQRINLRLVSLRQGPMLQLSYQHSTRDITHNHAFDEGVAVVQGLLGPQGFRNAHLHTPQGTDELSITQKGQAHVRHQAHTLDTDEAPSPTVSANHNREKQRMLSVDRPFLTALGVTTAAHSVVPAMARKWKQINKFVEVLAGALAASKLQNTRPLHIVDFGSGKGYLTFAMHDWLTHTQGLQAQVTGVELRPDMVALGNAVVEKLGLHGLRMVQGDVRSWQPQAMDVMVALHACDTATDHAIELGVRAGASIILCSPCCHKELRPQLLSPHPLRPILQHGVHMGQQAEMLTDGLRALLLEAAGYDTQVFEFISLEHTNKNKMILAVKRPAARSPAPVLAQIADLKSFYGIREQCLELLLAPRLAASVASATVAT
jgi:SAM-dependent methyltransferase